MSALPRLDGCSRPLRRAGRTALSALCVAAATPGVLAGAQAPHFRLPSAEIERRLAAEPFQIAAIDDNRWEDDRTQRAALRFRDGTILPVKWARSAEGGAALNNQPAYEIAAYRLQALFLDREDWVVPPTVLRVMPVRLYRQLDPELGPELGPTFEGTSSVLVVLQYWLDAVAPLERPDPARLDDAAYARRLGALNVLTFLIRHADSNTGNVLIATAGEPRMFAVDNGVAFTSPDSPRGTLWKDLHVTRLPGGTVARLRGVDRTMLENAVAVVAQLRVDAGGRLVAMDPTPRRRPHLSADFTAGVVQIGLTDREIDGVWNRLQDLLRRVDAGEITTY
ncbi:MAG TPA: hypothetical protein VMM12_16420 [Longimicrobiales bacterium]|nr:hypothetical protein [Longimicrobiales bacterium]